MINSNQDKIKNHRYEQSLFRRRLVMIFISSILLILGLFIRLYLLQIKEHQHYETLSKKNRLAYEPIAPKRGLIFDKDHKILAQNLPSYRLSIIPKKTPDIKFTIKRIKQFTSLDDADIKYFYKQLKYHKSFEPVPLKYNLSETEVAKLYTNLFQIPGAKLTTAMKRHYPKKNILTPILGYVGKINASDLSSINPKDYVVTPFIGKIGIEHYFENLLHGKVGFQTMEVNVSGLPQKSLSRIHPIPGNDITLTIDSKLQGKIYADLENETGAVVAINPQNGDILALVSRPSYDNNLFARGISHHDFQQLLNNPNLPLYNRALKGQFPPASTIKPFIALAALDQGIIKPSTTIQDTGTFRVPHTHHIYRDWLKTGHGRVNITKAIIFSCDVFFYQLATKMGMHNILPLLKKFGFGQSLELDTDFLSKGVLSSPNWKKKHQGIPWYTGDTIISFIGQGNMLITPMQLAQATSLLAMRGHGFQPHLLKSVKDEHQKIYHYKPKPHPVINLADDTWDIVIHAMHEVIFSPLPLATGWRFGHPAYSVAGKTGTAQIIHDERKHNQSNIPKQLRDHSWFIGFAPIDKPQIAIAVICEHSNKAAQIARKVMDHYLLNK